MRHFINVCINIVHDSISTLDSISKFVPHPFLVVMIAVKDTKSVSFLKLEPFIPTGLTNDFRLFDPFIVSVFV